MTTAPSSQPAQQTPKVVQVRVLGDMPGIAGFLRALTGAAQTGAFDVLDRTRATPNRREPGYRIYVTIRLLADDTDSRGAAHSHQAIRRPASPRPTPRRTKARHLP